MKSINRKPTKAKILAKVNPSVLRWARETLNFTIQEVCESLKLKEGMLVNAEKKTEILTIPQLKRLANKYKRSTTIFYLNEVPHDEKMPDFRSNSSLMFLPSDLNIKIRMMRVKKWNAEELYHLNQLTHDYSFIGKFTLQDKDVELAKDITELLKIKHGEYKSKKASEALNYFKEKVEDAKILVFQFPEIDVQISRGFSFAATPFPLIALNQKDSYHARNFTLFHEITHIFLNNSGICTSTEEAQVKNIEEFCNSVAAEILLPKKSLKAFEKINKTENNVQTYVKKLSSTYKVSYGTILMKLRSNELIEEQLFQSTFQSMCTSQDERKTSGGRLLQKFLCKNI